MQHWSGSAIVLRLNKISEYDGVLTVLSEKNGKQSAVVKGAYSKRMRPFLEVGNVIYIEYKSRTEEQLGVFNVEGDFNPSAMILGHAGRLTALSSACSVLEKSLYQGQHIEEVYAVFKSLLTTLDSPYWVNSYCKWEVVLLSELGIRLDFSQCASGSKDTDLIYVSPKSAKAVSRSAGKIYKEKLLPLPSLLITEAPTVTGESAFNSLKLTGHFIRGALQEHGVKDLPSVRGRLSDYFFNRYKKTF